MIDVQKNSRRFVSNQRHLVIDGTQAEIAEEFEIDQHSVFEAQLCSFRLRFFVQHLALLLFGRNPVCMLHVHSSMAINPISRHTPSGEESPSGFAFTEQVREALVYAFDGVEELVNP